MDTGDCRCLVALVSSPDNQAARHNMMSLLAASLVVEVDMRRKASNHSAWVSTIDSELDPTTSLDGSLCPTFADDDGGNGDESGEGFSGSVAGHDFDRDGTPLNPQQSKHLGLAVELAPLLSHFTDAPTRVRQMLMMGLVAAEPLPDTASRTFVPGVLHPSMLDEDNWRHLNTLFNQTKSAIRELVRL